jgi:glycosyltransferase involved in cell wall biosynthesis
MNILFYLATPKYGGIRTVTECLTSELIIRGHKVTWLIFNCENEKQHDILNDAQIYFLPHQILLSEENVNAYNDILRTEQIDIIINQHGLYEGINFLVKQAENVPIISVLHSNPISNYDWLFHDCMTLRDNTQKEWLKRIARFLLFPKIKYSAYKALQHQYETIENSASYINVLSPRYIETIHQINPYISKISAISNPNTYKTIKSVKKDKVVLFVGRLDNRSKKIQYLIKIWKSIECEIPEWKLIIVGSGQDENLLKDLANGVRSIEFVGYQNPEQYYERASILCLTSIFEGFPMAITEGMQHGCVPIVFGSFPAIYDIITPGVDGEIIKPFNKKDYANRLKYLINNLEYREKLSINATQSVKRYDVSNVVAQWENLFNEILGRRQYV